MIVGRGMAGMEAAIIAHDRGHKVLGGVFIAAVFYFKEADRNLIKCSIRELEKRNIEIHLNTEVNAELVNKNAPDVVIISTGAKERAFIV